MKTFHVKPQTHQSIKLKNDYLQLLATATSPLIGDKVGEFPEGREGVGEEGEVVVDNGHALEVELLEPRVGGDESEAGRGEVSTPVERH